MTIKPEILDELLAAWIQHPEPTGLKVSNACPPISTSTGTSPKKVPEDR